MSFSPRNRRAESVKSKPSLAMQAKTGPRLSHRNYPTSCPRNSTHPKPARRGLRKTMPTGWCRTLDWERWSPVLDRRWSHQSVEQLVGVAHAVPGVVVGGSPDQIVAAADHSRRPPLCRFRPNMTDRARGDFAESSTGHRILQQRAKVGLEPAKSGPGSDGCPP